MLEKEEVVEYQPPRSFIVQTLTGLIKFILVSFSLGIWFVLIPPVYRPPVPSQVAFRNAMTTPGAFLHTPLKTLYADQPNELTNFYTGLTDIPLGQQNQFLKVSFAVLLLLIAFVPQIVKAASYISIPLLWCLFLPVPFFEVFSLNFFFNFKLVFNTVLAGLSYSFLTYIETLKISSVISIIFKRLVSLLCLFAVPLVFLYLTSKMGGGNWLGALFNPQTFDAFVLLAGGSLFLTAVLYYSIPSTTLGPFIPLFGRFDRLLAAIALILGIILFIFAGMACLANPNSLLKLTKAVAE